jgi:phenylacetate-CoA ligase
VSAGLEALGMLGTACDENDGAHVAEDLAIAEVVERESGKPVGDGERGNLVVTVLEKDNAFLRYDLQDVVRTNRKPCPCGETHTRLFYEGRVKDIVAVAGREVLPIDVLLALLEAPAMKGRAIEYQIVRHPDPSALPVRVEHPAAETSDADATAGAISQALRSRLKIPLDLTLLPPGALPRFAFKAARVVDEA